MGADSNDAVAAGAAVSSPLPAALFAAEQFSEREVELADGKRYPMWFRHLKNSVFERYAIWRASRDEDVVAMAPSRLLVLGVCDPDGRPCLSVEQADAIDRSVQQRLILALMDVNGFSADKAAAEKQASETGKS